MDNNDFGTEIDFGIEDGRPKGNWREQTDESRTARPRGNVAPTQGAFPKQGFEGVRDARLPHIHKGQCANEPSIADVKRKLKNQ
jgi:hypothetical protein